MKNIHWYLLPLFLGFFITACSFSQEEVSIKTSQASTSIAASWTITPEPTKTPTQIATPSLTPSPTTTPTSTSFPTVTSTSTPTHTPQPVPITKDNIQNIEPIFSIGTDPYFNHINMMSLSQDGDVLVVSGEKTILLNINDKVVINEFGEGYFAAISPDGTLLASVNPDHNIDIWDLANNEISISLVGHSDEIRALAWNGDNNQLASFGMDGNLIVWETTSGEIYFRSEIPIEGYYRYLYILPFSWSPDSSYLAMATNKNVVRVFNGESIFILEGFSDIITHIAWSPNGEFLAAGSDFEPTVIVWRVSNWNIVAETISNQFRTNNVAWSPDSTHLLMSDAANIVKIRKATSLLPDQTFYNEWNLNVEHLEFSPDGSYILNLREVAGKWDANTFEQLEIPDDLLKEIIDSIWIPETNKIILRNYDDRVIIWDVVSDDYEILINPEIGFIRSMDISEDNQLLALGEHGGGILVYDLNSGDQIGSFNSKGWVEDISWSPDGASIVIASDTSDTDVKIINVMTGGEIPIESGESWSYVSVDWSPVDDIIVSGDFEGNIYLWDSNTGEQIKFWDIDVAVRDIKFSPDGKSIASITDKKLTIWNSVDGQILSSLPLGTNNHSLAWSKDGSLLAISEIFYNITHIINSATLEIVSDIDAFMSEPSITIDSSLIASNAEIWDTESGELLHDLGVLGDSVWTNDGYYLINTSNGLTFWGVVP